VAVSFYTLSSSEQWCWLVFCLFVWTSCLHLLSARITDMLHHVWPMIILI
jgi:hypothetical protein